MITRIKVTCTEITEQIYGHKIKFMPVISGSEENKKFFEATPWGEISFGTINKEVIKNFLVGKDYYLDFNLTE